MSFVLNSFYPNTIHKRTYTPLSMDDGHAMPCHTTPPYNVFIIKYFVLSKRAKFTTIKRTKEVFASAFVRPAFDDNATVVVGGGLLSRLQ